METDFQPFNWLRIFVGLQPPSYLFEVAMRCVIVFCLLILVMRMMGKRGQSNLSPMQQMLLIALGSAAGDALVYPTVPLLVTSLVLFGVTGLTVVLELLDLRFPRVRRFVEPRPRVLVRDGTVDDQALRAERTQRGELYAQLRLAGARSLTQVDLAILEGTGEMSVFLNKQPPSDHGLLDEATPFAGITWQPPPK